MQIATSSIETEFRLRHSLDAPTHSTSIISSCISSRTHVRPPVFKLLSSYRSVKGWSSLCSHLTRALNCYMKIFAVSCISPTYNNKAKQAVRNKVARRRSLRCVAHIASQLRNRGTESSTTFEFCRTAGRYLGNTCSRGPQRITLLRHSKAIRGTAAVRISSLLQSQAGCELMGFGFGGMKM